MCIRNLSSDKTTSAGVLQGPTTLWSLLLVSGSSSIQPIKKKKKKKHVYMWATINEKSRNTRLKVLFMCHFSSLWILSLFCPFDLHLIFSFSFPSKYGLSSGAW